MPIVGKNAPPDALFGARTAQVSKCRLLAHLVYYAANNLIFCQPAGQYYSPDRLGARVVELMRSVGLQGATLHSLRHSHTSILLSKGVPAAVVAQRLGHADQNITLSIYSHALPADSRAAAKLWSNAISGSGDRSSCGGAVRSVGSLWHASLAAHEKRKL
jgi:integrase